MDYDPEVPAGELSALHYTLGGPYIPGYENCGYSGLWYAERDRMLHAGRSAAAAS